MSGLSSFAASDRATAEWHAVLALFKQRLDKALQWGLQNIDAYAAAWAEETGVPVEVARLTLQARGFTPAPIDAGVIAGQQRTVDLYAREGVLPRRYDAADGFDVSFNV